jgi:hypothetical protein
MASVFRAKTISETCGFMKALIDTESDRILGFTMFGASAGEVMTTVQMTMLAGSPYMALRDAIITQVRRAEAAKVTHKKSNKVERQEMRGGLCGEAEDKIDRLRCAEFQSFR